MGNCNATEILEWLFENIGLQINNAETESSDVQEKSYYEKFVILKVTLKQ